jgi:large subunit ribosomal protein L13
MSYNKTTSLRSEDNPNNWIIIDAKNKILGHLATEIAKILRGKTHAGYTPHADTSVSIIVINSKQIRVTGNKLTEKMYVHHTGWMGGLKEISYRDLMKKDPTSPLLKAVQGMLPKNSLGRGLNTKLRVYPTHEHPHAAQQPTPFISKSK